MRGITYVNLKDLTFTLQKPLESRLSKTFSPQLISILDRSASKDIKFEGNATVGITAIMFLKTKYVVSQYQIPKYSHCNLKSKERTSLSFAC